MKRLLLWSLAFAMIGSTAVIAADLPSPLPLTREDPSERFVRHGLQKLGYTDVRNLYCSGSICNGAAVWKGKSYTLRIDSSNGEITSPQLDADDWNIRTTHDPDEDYVMKQLEALPFEQVKNVQRSGAFFNADAMYKGAPVKLEVDSASGRVTRVGGDDIMNIPVRADMDANAVRRGLQSIGFTDVDDVTQSGNFFNANAKRFGQPVKLQIEANTGTVSKQ